MSDPPVQGPAEPPSRYGPVGRRFDRGSPFYFGFVAASGAFLAWWLLSTVATLGSVILLVVVSAFLAVGLEPITRGLMARGMRRPWAVTVVVAGFLCLVAAFVFTLVPVITEQVAALAANIPDWLETLQSNRLVQRLDEQYQIIDKAREFLLGGDLLKQVFGGVLGVGAAVIVAVFNAFFLIILTLYFLASLPRITNAVYRLAPASRRERVSRLGDEMLHNIGGYVSGAFVVALCAGVTTLVFLVIVGLGEYAIALAFTVAVLDVIPMIGATLGGVLITAIGFATDVKVGIACLVFAIVYQQIENYVIYPRVMSRQVDIPGLVIVIAALVGGSLLGVVGALLAVPMAAALLLVYREVIVPAQDAR